MCSAKVATDGSVHARFLYIDQLLNIHLIRDPNGLIYETVGKIIRNIGLENQKLSDS